MASIPLVTTRPEGSHTVGRMALPAPGRADGPLISCLMVTRGDRPAIGLAIACYRRQTYPHRELVIVADAHVDRVAALVEAAADPSIRLIRADRASLGELRNRSVDSAAGDLFCQWDDDDLSDPGRLDLQLAALDVAQAAASFLLRWMIWWPDRRRIAVSSARLWEGSMLIRRAEMRRYAALAIGEDFELVAQLRTERPLAGVDSPTSYCYIVHGGNTCPPTHFDLLWDNAAARCEGAAYDAMIARLAPRMPVRDYPTGAVAP